MLNNVSICLPVSSVSAAISWQANRQLVVYQKARQSSGSLQRLSASVRLRPRAAGNPPVLHKRFGICSLQRRDASLSHLPVSCTRSPTANVAIIAAA